MVFATAALALGRRARGCRDGGGIREDSRFWPDGCGGYRNGQVRIELGRTKVRSSQRGGHPLTTERASVATPLTRGRCHRPPPSPSTPQGTVNFPGRIPLRQVMPLIVCPLTSGKSQLHLNFAVLILHRKLDQGRSLARSLARQPVTISPCSIQPS